MTSSIKTGWLVPGSPHCFFIDVVIAVVGQGAIVSFTQDSGEALIALPWSRERESQPLGSHHSCFPSFCSDSPGGQQLLPHDLKKTLPFPDVNGCRLTGHSQAQSHQTTRLFLTLTTCPAWLGLERLCFLVSLPWNPADTGCSFLRTRWPVGCVRKVRPGDLTSVFEGICPRGYFCYIRVTQMLRAPELGENQVLGNIRNINGSNGLSDPSASVF